MFGKLLLAGVITALSINYGNAQVPEETDLMAKPIPCADAEVGRSILYGFYELGLRPIMGFVGTSYTSAGKRYPSDYYILYNPEDNQLAIIEKFINGQICVVTGVSKSWMSFDSEKLEGLIFDMLEEKL